MRILFWVTLAANMALIWVSIAISPVVMATHFGIDGMANGWSKNYVYGITMTGLQIFLFCLFYFMPRLISLFPAGWINLPNKEYWLSPAMKPLAIQKLQPFMCSLGIAMLLLFFAAGLLTLQANLSNPVKLNVYAFHAMLGAFLAYNIYWVIMLYRAFRVPSKENWGRKNINHV